MRTRSCCSIAFWNAGVSWMRSRTYRPMNTSSELARNGMRQPKLKNSASLSVSDNNRNTPPAQRKPSGEPSWGKMPDPDHLHGDRKSVVCGKSVDDGRNLVGGWILPKQQLYNNH